MVEDNVKEVADALNDLTEDLADGIISPDNVAHIANTLANIIDVEDPSEGVNSVCVFVFSLKST